MLPRVLISFDVIKIQINTYHDVKTLKLMEYENWNILRTGNEFSM